MRLLLTLLLLWTSSAHALVLEDLVQDGRLKETLKGRKIGYYLGSFDPLHKGHEAVALLPISQGLCDFVLIYPSWGGDSYKTRVDVNLRLDMLFAIFKDHPKVIVTRLSPLKMQETLTVLDSSKTQGEMKFVQPAFEGTEFIGIIGSDTAISLNGNDKASASFMTGIQIPEEYEAHTLGGCMALPVDGFIVALRGNDNLAPLEGTVSGRKIIAVIKGTNAEGFSSTGVKRALNDNKSIDSMVSPPVKEIIESHHLYKQGNLTINAIYPGGKTMVKSKVV